MSRIIKLFLPKLEPTRCTFLYAIHYLYTVVHIAKSMNGKLIEFYYILRILEDEKIEINILTC